MDLLGHGYPARTARRWPAGTSPRPRPRTGCAAETSGWSSSWRSCSSHCSSGSDAGPFETLIEGSARAIKGRLARDVDELDERIFRQSVADLIYPEMRELICAHQRRGHTVVLSSSALTNQVAPAARYLGIDDIVCNPLVADEQGMLTGEIEQLVVWGPTKASGVREFAAEHQVDLAASYFYADGDEDLTLMCLVGHPRPTNPGRWRGGT
jgi:putative phosphoserine phosphatase/1-acylglycerol-3-phosphate O-acyltransferase